MKKILLLDGNSMLFRAYYATVYGRMMRTSNGIPTNAVFGFVTMFQKALEQIAPDGVLVAWDAGKPTFRHEAYSEYKGTRKELDQELIVQFPITREFLDACGVKRYECEGIEADDIIGSFVSAHPEVAITILSSDRDLLQLIDETTDVLLMKKGISEMQLMNVQELQAAYGLRPEQIVDLKALMGDSADNIPGVKGVGEKTALKLLSCYDDVDGVYAHLDEIKGKLQEKLAEGKESAMLSRFLATIRRDADIPFTLQELSFDGFAPEVNDFFRKYEMKSFLQQEHAAPMPKRHIRSVDHIEADLSVDGTIILADCDNEHYTRKVLYGFALYCQGESLYITLEDARHDARLLDYLANDPHKITYNAKEFYHAAARNGIACSDFALDLMLGSFLLDSSITSFERFLDHYQIALPLTLDEVYGKKGKNILPEFDRQCAYMEALLAGMAPIVAPMKEKLRDEGMWELLTTLEMPLSRILFKMEQEGIHISEKVLDEIGEVTHARMEENAARVYEYAGHEFNINSPKQLGIVLFDEIGLKSGKKRSTAVEVLEKLRDAHPIIPCLLDYRKYAKLYTTYVVGLKKHISRDQRIHTIFNQALAQTGRLSSSEPNLQNISVRDEEGREIRKAFVAEEGHVFLSADYSQIELRMLAHMADETQMIDAFSHGIDIHTKTAMQIFDVSADEVDASMRRSAKTVNFGIVYGQSDYGLSEQLGISRKEAHSFIEKYFASYPKIHAFMNETIAFCEEHGYVTTMFQRRRYIPEINDKNYMMREFGKRAAMNAPIQGSAADLIKMAMIAIDKKMQEEQVRSRMILQIHDELIFDVPQEEIEQMKRIVEDGMQNVVKLKVPLVANASIGHTWYDAK